MGLFQTSKPLPRHPDHELNKVQFMLGTMQMNKTVEVQYKQGRVWLGTMEMAETNIGTAREAYDS
jgi:hypothetical protein